jgi:hypothetical protein
LFDAFSLLLGRGVYENVALLAQAPTHPLVVFGSHASPACQLSRDHGYRDADDYQSLSIGRKNKKYRV